VAYLHFDGEHLSFSQVAFPYPKTAKDLPRCRACKATCAVCVERQKQARRRWNEREAAKTTPVEVLEIEDSGTLKVICEALPEMHKRLVDDSKVTPEQIEDAIRSVQDFLAALKA
jgi:bacterioferritin-associated ferredoxin